MEVRVILRALAVAGAILGAEVAAAQSDPLANLPQHIALGNQLHVSGQPTLADFQALPAAGVRQVIDLRLDSETPGLDEKSAVELAGMKYESIPIAGAQDLTRENVAIFDQVLKDAGSGKVLVHCASGNRVGALMALRARWSQGKTAEEALAIGKQAGLTGLTGEVTKLLETDAVSSASPKHEP